MFNTSHEWAAAGASAVHLGAEGLFDSNNLIAGCLWLIVEGFISFFHPAENLVGEKHAKENVSIAFSIAVWSLPQGDLKF